MTRAHALKPGDTIRIVASSSPFERDVFEAGISVLKNWGFVPKYEKGIFSKRPYLAGTDKRRLCELVSALNDDRTKAILFARGGYGAMRLLAELAKTRITGKPKIILGYSDITCLLVYLQQRLGWINFYGPVVAGGIHPKAHPDTLLSLQQCLTQPQPYSKIWPEETITLCHGKCTAPLVGGCLSLIVALLGTPYEIITKGRILFLEDTNEKPYAIDRMLTHLKLTGKLNTCKGLIFGPMLGPNPTEHYRDTIMGVVKDLGIPVLFNFPAGHGKTQLTLPLGIKVHLNTKANTLQYLEPSLT